MEWKYDSVSFDSTIRRSGGSLVITIPPELRRRFQLQEGQPVRLIGVVKPGVFVEGGIMVYLGKFKVAEVVNKVEAILAKAGAVEKADVELISSLLEENNIHNYSVSRLDENRISVSMFISCITKEGIVELPKDVVNVVMNEVAKRGYSVVDLRTSKEEVTWYAVDPSVLSRFSAELPESVKIEWDLR